MAINVSEKHPSSLGAREWLAVAELVGRLRENGVMGRSEGSQMSGSGELAYRKDLQPQVQSLGASFA